MARKQRLKRGKQQNCATVKLPDVAGQPLQREAPEGRVFGSPHADESVMPRTSDGSIGRVATTKKQPLHTLVGPK